MFVLCSCFACLLGWYCSLGIVGVDFRVFGLEELGCIVVGRCRIRRNRCLGQRQRHSVCWCGSGLFLLGYGRVSCGLRGFLIFRRILEMKARLLARRGSVSYGIWLVFGRRLRLVVLVSRVGSWRLRRRYCLVYCFIYRGIVVCRMSLRRGLVGNRVCWDIVVPLGLL